MTKRTVTMIDPPSGWRYGFPKPLPDHIRGEEATAAWLIEQGYPEKDAKLLRYCRFWETKIDDDATL